MGGLVGMLVLWVGVLMCAALVQAWSIGDALAVEGKVNFDPYADNGGTVVALAGDDYCLIASDTRLSDQYSIKSRSILRLSEVAEGVCFAGSGCWADILELALTLRGESMRFLWENDFPISTSALAHLLSGKLYERRTFPYFGFCAVAGLDAEGRGEVFRFDAVGSFERVVATCSGKGEQLIQPMLDEATRDSDDSLWTLSEGHDAFSSPSRSLGLSVSQACELVVRAFRAAAEREISLGDGLDVWIVARDLNESGGPFTGKPKLIKRHFPLPAH